MARHKRRWWERLRRHSGYVGRHRATSASEAWNLGVSLAEAYPAYYTPLRRTAPEDYWDARHETYDLDDDVCWPEGVDGKCPQCRTPKHRAEPTGVSLIDVESLDELFKVDDVSY